MPMFHHWQSLSNFFSVYHQPFAEIIQLTDVHEGIIVRTIQRLHETLSDVRSAARLIGDRTLAQKMEDSMEMVKRDIVFAASLYTQWTWRNRRSNTRSDILIMLNGSIWSKSPFFTFMDLLPFFLTENMLTTIRGKLTFKS